MAPINNPPNPSANQSADALTFDKCSNQEINLKSNTPKTFLGTNKSRIYAIIVNTSLQPITLILGNANNAVIGQGIPLVPWGSYEICPQNLYTGKLTAISPVDGTLSFVECTH